MLGRANHIWRASYPHEFYGGSYKTMDPHTHFDQSLGLIMSTAIASHLLRVHKQIRTIRTTCTNFDDDSFWRDFVPWDKMNYNQKVHASLLPSQKIELTVC